MTLRDDKETIGLFEPLMVGEGSPHRGELNDLALDLAARAAAFRSSLPDQVAAALATLSRATTRTLSILSAPYMTITAPILRSATSSSKPRRISPSRNGLMTAG